MRRILFGLFAGALMSQTPQQHLTSSLCTGRNDLWVFGVDRDPVNGSVLVELRSWKVPTNLWGSTGTVPRSTEVLYSERPMSWDWTGRPGRQLGRDFYYHLSKYDDISLYAPDWGVAVDKDGNNLYEGAILRFQNGHLELIPNGSKQARIDHGLNEAHNFLGMVGNKVFYFDSSQRDRIFFFDKGIPNQLFELLVSIHPLWPKSWKVESVEQVFAGDKPDEVVLLVWVKNMAWISAKPRRAALGLAIDIKAAKRVAVAPK